MNPTLPTVLLARHGETAWSRTGQHTGCRSDLPLTAVGEQQARQLGQRLRRLSFESVFCSPLQRAMQTCELVGFQQQAIVDADLVEWDYGEYEGLTTAEIRQRAPVWRIYRDGCPNGESVSAAVARVDRFLDRLRILQQTSLVVSSGHFLRLLAARWCGWNADAAEHLLLDTAALCSLGYDHGLDEPVIRFWNDVSHIEA